MAAGEMKSVATRRFWTLFRALPRDVQNLAIKNYNLWRREPNHPSLHYHRLKGSDDRFTIRVGDHYRALGTLRSDSISWVWIGTHSEYDRLVNSK
jgi:hypothetical protein